MNNATPALLAFLLVLSLPAMPVVAASPDSGNSSESGISLQQDLTTRIPPVEYENTTNRLELTGDVKGEYAEYHSDLGTALASADDELRVDHDQYVIVDSEFADATDEEQAEMIQTAYDRLKNRTAELEQREREAVKAHAADELSTAELLRILVRNHNEAVMLAESLDELDGQADRVSGYSLSPNQTRTAKQTFSIHQTQGRAIIEQMNRIPTDSDRDIVVSTSENGYRLSIMDGDRYLIETTRYDNRNDTGSDQFDDLDSALDYTRDLYPWADGQALSFQDNSHTPENYYWAEFSHDQGRLQVYLDGGTGDVFREVQELAAPSLPVEEKGPWTNSGLNMTMDRTPTDGPIMVSVTDNKTGEPERAMIMVDGVEVGETDDDGTLWVIPPIGSHKLTAKTADGNVTAITQRSYN